MTSARYDAAARLHRRGFLADDLRRGGGLIVEPPRRRPRNKPVRPGCPLQMHRLHRPPRAGNGNAVDALPAWTTAPRSSGGP